jgi:purine-binding chemotaxis protein CheW
MSSSSEASESERGSSDLVLLFRARGLLLALPTRRLREILRPLPTARLPGIPKCVLGAARIRGNPTPVVDLGILLGASDPLEATRFLVLNLGERRVALAVEEVVGVRRLGSESLSELPSLLASADTELVATVGALDGELLLSLDAARLVPETLWRAVPGASP